LRTRGRASCNAGLAAMNTPRPAARRWRDAAGEHIDVRGLPKPQPLVAVLRLLHGLPTDAPAVIVHIDRDPLGLYPELAEIGWQATRLPDQDGAVRLRLQRLHDPFP